MKHPKTNPNYQAFPGVEQEGMTIRQYFAAQAMQGICAAGGNDFGFSHGGRVAEIAVSQADALITALNAPMCPDCKMSNADGHYDTEHNICPTYERWASEREAV